MRIGIVGSRRRTDRVSIERLVQSLSRTDIVVSGGCAGPDKWAVAEADRRMMSHKEYLPILRPGMGRDEVVQAYYDRNKLIAKDSDRLYAFVAKDRSGGTENTIKHAVCLGIEVFIMKEAQEIDETEPIMKKLTLCVYNKKNRYPKGAVYVGRPTKYGNPFSHMPGTLADRRVYSREDAVRLYGAWLRGKPLLIAQAQQELGGKNLVCWCSPLPCHADILFAIANEVNEVDET